MGVGSEDMNTKTSSNMKLKAYIHPTPELIAVPCAYTLKPKP